MEIFTHIVRSLSPFLRDLAYFIVVLWAYFLARMTWQAYRVQNTNKAILSILRTVSEASNEERVDGLPLERIQLIRTVIKDSNEHVQEWWRSVEGALLPYTAYDGDQRWYISNAARELLAPEELFEAYSEGSHQAVPGLLTALGLLGTFSALLLGLADLRYTEKAVLGLADLINALSGKFFTSVLALGSSVLFVLVERFFLAASFERLYSRICSRFDSVFPRLRQERILIDIRASAQKQADSLSHISSDLVGQLTGAFQSQIVPSFAGDLAEQMTLHLLPAIQKMEGALERLESQKQDSVVGEIRSLVTTLETAITSALSDMGNRFHEQLTGSAQSEFAAVQETLASTSQLGEIESLLLEHPTVAEAAVAAHRDADSITSLAAYLVAKSGCLINIDALRWFLAGRVPAYMMPSSFMVLDAMPLTPNGKLDRKSLAVPERVGRMDYAEPVTPVEKKLAALWRSRDGRAFPRAHGGRATTWRCV